MADEIDLANEHNEFFRKLVLENRPSGDVDIYGNGSCVVCGQKVEPKLANGKPVIGRFCDSECASDFQSVV